MNHVVDVVIADRLADVIALLVVDPTLLHVVAVVTTPHVKTTAGSVTTIGVIAIDLEAQMIEIVK